MTAATKFDGLEIGPAGRADAVVIWLHGLGADAHDFEPIVPELHVGATVRFVFPNAPVRPVTINNGMAMRAWYDILSFERGSVEDTAGIRASCDLLLGLIERELARGISADRLILAGFSQGGAIALTTGLETERRHGGVLALSTYLPRTAGTESALRTDVPVWMGHGTMDPVLPLQLAEASRRRLQTVGIEPEWHTYPMAHSVCVDEVADIRRWLTTRLGEAQQDSSN